MIDFCFAQILMKEKNIHSEILSYSLFSFFFLPPPILLPPIPKLKEQKMILQSWVYCISCC